MWPKVVKAWLADQAKHEWPLAAMIDPARGLAVISWRRGLDQSEPARRSGSVANRSRKKSPTFARRSRSATRASIVDCANKPAARCSFKEAEEYPTSSTLLFRPDANGDLKLDAVFFRHADGHLNETTAAQQDHYFDAQWKKLADSTCP